jgi:hypothetical protein
MTDYGRTRIVLSDRLAFCGKKDLQTDIPADGNCQMVDFAATVVGGMDAEIYVEQPSKPDLANH